MSYELIFHYKKEVERGKYSDEEESKVVRIGSLGEDTPLASVAGRIFAQLAKRSIFITDVEIYEFQKKKLSYKEAEDGILIKNKKFKFDDGALVETKDMNKDQQDISEILEKFSEYVDWGEVLKRGGKNSLQLEDNSPPSVITPPSAVKSTPAPIPAPVSANVTIPVPLAEQPIRHELFDPPPWLLAEAKSRGLKFTVGKKYPIFKEKMTENPSAGMIYSTINDDGIRQSLSSVHFNIATNLTGDFVEDNNSQVIGSQLSEPKLSWDGVVPDQTIHLR